MDPISGAVVIAATVVGGATVGAAAAAFGTALIGSCLAGAALLAVTLLILDLVFSRRIAKTEGLATNAAGKVVVVTSAKAGVGWWTARALALGGAHVIVASSDAAKGQRAAEEIQAAVGISRSLGRAEFMHLKLTSLRSVQRFNDEFRRRNLKLHILINNGGPFKIEPKTMHNLTEDDLQVTLARHHYGLFYLTQLLLDKLAENPYSRIVYVSSSAEAKAPAAVKFDELKDGGKKLKPEFRTYAMAKLFNLLTVRELQRRVSGSGVEVFAARPGTAAAEVAIKKTGWKDSAKRLPGLRTLEVWTPRPVADAARRLPSGLASLIYQYLQAVRRFTMRIVNAWLSFIPGWGMVALVAGLMWQGVRFWAALLLVAFGLIWRWLLRGRVHSMGRYIRGLTMRRGALPIIAAACKPELRGHGGDLNYFVGPYATWVGIPWVSAFARVGYRPPKNKLCYDDSAPAALFNVTERLLTSRAKRMGSQLEPSPALQDDKSRELEENPVFQQQQAAAEQHVIVTNAANGNGTQESDEDRFAAVAAAEANASNGLVAEQQRADAAERQQEQAESSNGAAERAARLEQVKQEAKEGVQGIATGLKAAANAAGLAGTTAEE